MKILLTINDISITGGAERVCVNLANALSELGHQVSVLSFYRVNAILPYRLDESVNLHIWHNLSEAEYAKKHSNFFSKMYYKNLYKFILSLQVSQRFSHFDVIISNCATYTPFFKYSKTHYCRIIHLNFSKYHSRNNYFDVLIILSSAELSAWQYYHNNIKVIPNFLPNISQKNTDSNQRRIISVGRMDRGDQKGFLRLIDIWEKVQERINRELESAPLEQVQNVRVQNSETLESNPCSTNSPHCHTEHSEVSNPCHTTPTSCHVERSETSKNLESKKDISPFSKANTIRKDFAHTCKYDKIDSHETILDSKQISAEVVCDDFKNCEALSARSLSINDEARKANSLKRAETATHKKSLESWQLIIVGSGVLQEQIESKIKEKNLQDSIILKPFTKDVEKEYLSASIYAMTSYVEGFPMVLLESCSYALCPIAFDVATGPSDIIESNISGYLIEDNDLQGYADKLFTLMSDKDKRESMGLKAKRRVKEKFSKEVIMPLWEEVFRG